MGQTGSHVEYEHDPFIKRVSRVNPNMTQTHFATTHNPFINRLVVLGLQVMSKFATLKSNTANKETNKKKLINIQKFNQISKEYEKEIKFFP